MSVLSTPHTGFRYGLPDGDRADIAAWRESQRPVSTASALKRKDIERQVIAEDIAAFEKRKGRIETLPGFGAKR